MGTDETHSLALRRSHRDLNSLVIQSQTAMKRAVGEASRCCVEPTPIGDELDDVVLEGWHALWLYLQLLRGLSNSCCWLHD